MKSLADRHVDNLRLGLTEAMEAWSAAVTAASAANLQDPILNERARERSARMHSLEADLHRAKRSYGIL